MQDLAQGVRAQIIKETKPKVAAPGAFTMVRLRLAALWGSGAAAALLLAVLSSRGEVSTERLAAILHGNFHGDVSDDRPQAKAPTFDAEAATDRLAVAVRGLAADRDLMKSRLAAVEQNMDDFTGSISKQIEAAKPIPRPVDGPTVMDTATVTAALVPVASSPVAGFPAPVEAQSPAGGPMPASLGTAYGADIGSGLTVQALRSRWLAIRAAHPQLLEGLEPIVSFKEVPHANRVEFRLVVGPFPEAGAAQHLCAALAPFGVFCQPTMFDGQRLALQ